MKWRLSGGSDYKVPPVSLRGAIPECLVYNFIILWAGEINKSKQTKMGWINPWHFSIQDNSRSLQVPSILMIIARPGNFFLLCIISIVLAVFLTMLVGKFSSWNWNGANTSKWHFIFPQILHEYGEAGVLDQVWSSLPSFGIATPYKSEQTKMQANRINLDLGWSMSWFCSELLIWFALLSKIKLKNDVKMCKNLPS